MLGMRGMRDRWSESLERLGKLMEKGTTLMDKAVDYIDELKILTKTLVQTLNQQQKVLEQDLELKKAEMRRVELEIQGLLEDRSKKSKMKEKKQKDKR